MPVPAPPGAWELLQRPEALSTTGRPGAMTERSSARNPTPHGAAAAPPTAGPLLENCTGCQSQCRIGVSRCTRCGREAAGFAQHRKATTSHESTPIHNSFGSSLVTASAVTGARSPMARTRTPSGGLLSQLRSSSFRSLNGEFDPGSGRTLAAGLTHASRGTKRGACSAWKPANG